MLVASPRMLDPNFMHAVVLLCEHNDDGTFGLILNRRLDIAVADLGSDLELLNSRKDPVFAGGPVQPTELQVLHRTGSEIPGAMAVVDGVAFGGDPDVLHAAFASSPDAPIRFVLGYAGWGPGQLGAEMSERSWIVVSATVKRIFDPNSETLWRRVLRAEGGEVAGLADLPPDPSWN